MNDPAQPAAPQPQAPTSGLAIASLICGILGLTSVCCAPVGALALAGVICGHISLSQIKKSNGAIGGQGLALAGTIVSWVAMAAAVVGTIFFLMALGERSNEVFEEINRKLEEERHRQEQEQGEARIYWADPDLRFG